MTAQNDSLEAAYDFFKDALPDVVAIEAHTFDDVRDERLQAAGLALAEVILRDGLTCYATYIVRPTPHTAALNCIYVEEEVGALPAGTHDNAIDAIISGEFEAQFGGYIER